MNEMTGKVIVVTGGSSGMGAAMVEAFVEQGAKVGILDIAEEKGLALAKKLGKSAVYHQVDVTSKTAVEIAVNQVEDAFGPLTSFVNSAGVSEMVPFLESSEELWELTMNVNLKATFLCCQVAVAHMLQHGGGEILNMSSLSGKKASSWQTIYCASKFGVQGLTQSIAKEFADQNIRVNSICPGIVQTEMWEKLKYQYGQKRGIEPDKVMDYFKANVPMQRLVDLQDVVHSAIFLLTDKSSYLTGQSINLAGGEWME